MNQTRLLLEQTYNTRELGGYPIDFETQTAWRTFLRSDDISMLTERDRDRLHTYGITAIIDLRSVAERDETGYSLEGDQRFRCYHLPLNTEDVTDATRVLTQEPDRFLPTFYKNCLQKSQEQLYSIFKILAQDEGGILFHCAAGKDRTGIVAALLMGVAGVGEADILSNYEVSYGYNTQNPLFQKHVNGYPEEVLFSKKEYLQEALTEMLAEYHSYADYLSEIGLTSKELELLNRKLIMHAS